ncbi:MAG: helix-turn-helix domain-containing protein [Corallococcus sp.]|nr:helix-turn-helix domain-containing protein [Corallococcus sp.]
MTLGETILKHRRIAGISQEELANMLNVTRQSISLWETDQTLPSIDSLVKLAEIFNISLDELCGRKQPDFVQTVDSVCPNADIARADTDSDAETAQIIADGTNPTAPIAPKETPQIVVQTPYTKSLLVNIISVIYKPFFVASIIAIIASVFVLIKILASEEIGNAFVIIPAVFLLIFTAAYIRIATLNGKNIQRVLAANTSVKASLYKEYFEIDSVSENSSVHYRKKYSEVKKTVNANGYILVFFDNVIAPISKTALGENYGTAIKLFEPLTPNKTNTDTATNSASTVKSLLTAFFVLALISVIIGMVIAAAVTQLSPLPEYRAALTEYIWVMFCVVPLPVASIVLGIIYSKKNYKCKKNIVAGSVMTVLLLIYGSISFMLPQVKHDYRYVQQIDAMVPATLPSGYVSYTIHSEGNVLSDGMVKFYNPAGMQNAIDGDPFWQKKDDFAMPSSLPRYYALSTMDYDYFYLYDTTCARPNSLNIGTHNGHRFVYMAYSAQEGLLVILDYKYDTAQTFAENKAETVSGSPNMLFRHCTALQNDCNCKGHAMRQYMFYVYF